MATLELGSCPIVDLTPLRAIEVENLSISGLPKAGLPPPVIVMVISWYHCTTE
jgi:hypothetical protein